jgi:putative ABC transport system permease protein
MAQGELLSTAFHSLRINLLRSTLSTVGIVVAIAIVIVLISMGSGVRGEVIAQIESLGPNIIIIKPGAEEAEGDATTAEITQLNLSTLSEDDVEALRGLEAVSMCSGTIEGAVQVTGPEDKKVNSSLHGVDADFWRMRDITLQEGEEVTEGAGYCVLGDYLSRKFFGVEGNRGVGETVQVSGSSFEVKGVVEHRHKSIVGDPNREIYVSLEDARAMMGGSELQVSRISASVEDGADMDAAKAEIEETVKRSHGGEEDFNLASQEDLVASYDRILSLLNALVSGIAFAALVVGGIGIANIMYISVKERTSEIGVRMAQGASKSDIIKQFLAESVVLCMIGGLLGVPLGIFIAFSIDRYTVMSCTTPIWVILMAFAAAVLTGVVAGVFPSVQATRIDIGEALRKE